MTMSNDLNPTRISVTLSAYEGDSFPNADELFEVFVTAELHARYPEAEIRVSTAQRCTRVFVEGTWSPGTWSPDVGLAQAIANEWWAAFCESFPSGDGDGAVVAAMTDVVASGGDRVLGGESPACVALEWLEAGLSPELAEGYIEAGAWDADRAGQLLRAGIKADDLVDDDVVGEVIKARDWVSVSRGGAGYSADDMYDSLGYSHSNNDVSTEEISAAVRAAGRC